MTEVRVLRDEIQRLKGAKDNVALRLQTVQGEVAELERYLKQVEQARAIIQVVSQQTQQQLQFHISEMVSLALAAVFDHPYQLNLEFSLRRGKTEADITFYRGNEESVHPLTASGGGVVDIAAFALRVALWSLQRPRSRNVLILDEPFRFLSRNLQPRAAVLLKELSQKLDLQIIMISHSLDLCNVADRVFEVTQARGVSTVHLKGNYNG